MGLSQRAALPYGSWSLLEEQPYVPSHSFGIVQNPCTHYLLFHSVVTTKCCRQIQQQTRGGSFPR